MSRCEWEWERGDDVQLVEGVRLERPDRLGEEAGADEEEEVGHDDHEDGESCVHSKFARPFRC